MGYRAVVITDLQADPQPEDWKIATREKSRPSSGHVLVRMALIPINPTDTGFPKMRMGHLKGQEVVPGSEGVGYIEEVGEGVTKLKVGQRVVPSFLSLFVAKGAGSWREYVEAVQDELFVLPDTIPDDAAAQFFVNPWTLYGLLKDQDIPKGGYLLQSAANSVLGRQVIQLAKYWEIKTINLVRRDEFKEELKSLGADEVINASKEDVIARVKEITGGKGVDGSLDAVGGINTKTMVSCTRNGGKVFVYGVLGTPEFEVTVGVFDLGRVELKFWNLQSYLARPGKFEEVAKAVVDLLEKKVITPKTGKIFDLGDFKAAILESEKPGRVGKVMLSM